MKNDIRSDQNDRKLLKSTLPLFLTPDPRCPKSLESFPYQLALFPTPTPTVPPPVQHQLLSLNHSLSSPHYDPGGVTFPISLPNVPEITIESVAAPRSTSFHIFYSLYFHLFTLLLFLASLHLDPKFDSISLQSMFFLDFIICP